MALSDMVNGLRRTLEGTGFDRRFVGGLVIDTGMQAERARQIAAKLNAVRSGLSKEPLVIWRAKDYSAVTKRGRWIYVAMSLAERLSDDALAFVLAHEMAHHDLGHVSTPLGLIARLGFGEDAELAADREGLRIAAAAGFDPRGGLQALSRDLWDGEAELPKASWQDWMRGSHPPLEIRLKAIEDWLSANPGPSR